MPKSSPRRNAAEARIRRFLKGFTGNAAYQFGAGTAVRSGYAIGLGPKYKNPPNPIRTERAH